MGRPCLAWAPEGDPHPDERRVGDGVAPALQLPQDPGVRAALRVGDKAHDPGGHQAGDSLSAPLQLRAQERKGDGRGGGREHPILCRLDRCHHREKGGARSREALGQRRPHSKDHPGEHARAGPGAMPTDTDLTHRGAAWARGADVPHVVTASHAVRAGGTRPLRARDAVASWQLLVHDAGGDTRAPSLPLHLPIPVSGLPLPPSLSPSMHTHRRRSTEDPGEGRRARPPGEDGPARNGAAGPWVPGPSCGH